MKPTVFVRYIGLQPGFDAVPTRALFNVVSGAAVPADCTVTIETLEAQGFQVREISSVSHSPTAVMPGTEQGGAAASKLPAPVSPSGAGQLPLDGKNWNQIPDSTPRH